MLALVIYRIGIRTKPPDEILPPSPLSLGFGFNVRIRFFFVAHLMKTDVLNDDLRRHRDIFLFVGTVGCRNNWLSEEGDADYRADPVANQVLVVIYCKIVAINWITGNQLH